MNTKNKMIENLNKLRKLVFPTDNLSTISYGGQISALAFSPTFVYFTITGLYQNLFAYVEELSFAIDDNTSWARQYYDEVWVDDGIGGKAFLGVDNTFDTNKNAPYPTVIDVSLGFKVIPNFGIKNDEQNTNVYRYNYDFTNGGNIGEIESDYPQPDPKVIQAKQENNNNYPIVSSQNSQESVSTANPAPKPKPKSNNKSKPKPPQTPKNGGVVTAKNNYVAPAAARPANTGLLYSRPF